MKRIIGEGKTEHEKKGEHEKENIRGEHEKKTGREDYSKRRIEEYAMMRRRATEKHVRCDEETKRRI